MRAGRERGRRGAGGAMAASASSGSCRGTRELEVARTSVLLAVLEEEVAHSDVVLVALRDEVACEEGGRGQHSVPSRARGRATHHQCATASCC